jgi:succinate dehydrogenase / fumarate reductase cytochrome b subunit
LLSTAVGKKLLMALSGIGGLGFVLVHMLGNLQMFKPAGAAQAMHDYAVGIRALGPVLLIARAGLVGLLLAHVVMAVLVTRRNLAARPVRYAMRRPQTSTLASRLMRVGGVVLLVFIVFHLADMTFGIGHPQFTHLDPYNNLRIGFSRWWAVAFYLVAIAALGLHLYHGLWAAWRTLGARQPSREPLHRNIAVIVAILISIGFAVVPIAAALGLFPEAPVRMDPVHQTAPVLPEPAVPAAGGGS